MNTKWKDSQAKLLFESKVKSYPKQFQIIDSPQIIARISQFRRNRDVSVEPSFHLDTLLIQKRAMTTKKISSSRETYRMIKQKISKTLEAMRDSKRQLSFGEVLIWKQEILASFMNEYLGEIGKECKEKGQILLFIWNSVFNIIQYLFSLVGELSHQDEKQYLNNLLDNHKNYQEVIENQKGKIAKREKEYVKQEEFIKALVYTLRYKRKEIKKLTKNLKMCTIRLNEIKDFYLDLQLEHIELLSQNRDISKENAKNLLKRKQEINHERRKQYKMKQSHKKIRFQIQTEILNENDNESQNVSRLNNELQTTFTKYYDQSKSVGERVNYQNTQSLFENALDEFNVRIQEVPQTESLIDIRSNIGFVDAVTDMADFVYNVEERETQVTFSDRFLEDMISHASVQTADTKTKPKIMEESSAEVNFIQLKSLRLNRVRVYDRSYILQDYRDKRYKNEQAILFKLNSEKSFGANEVNHLQNYRIQKQNKEQRRRLQSYNNNVEVQTENEPMFIGDNVPNDFRNELFQKEVEEYVRRANALFQLKKEKMNERKGSKISERPFKLTQRKGARSIKSAISVEQSTLDQNLLSQEETIIDRNTSMDASRLSRSKHSTSRQGERNRLKVHFGRRELTSNKQLKRVLRKEAEGQFDTIEQNKYQQLVSNQLCPSGRIGLMEDRKMAGEVTREATVRKFWVMKPEGYGLNLDKQDLIKKLNKGEQILSKTSLHLRSENFLQNKKILAELQKLSQQLQSKSGGFQLIEENAIDNMNILREQLRKMLLKKRNNRKLPISRQQSLCKIVSFVYTYAYHLYFNHKKSLQNLIIPLFHHFRIGYGQIKKNDLYLRMLYFLSQIICHQHEYYIFESFILFLGLNIEGQRQLKIEHETTCLYLKLLHKLSVNFKFPLNVDQLYTTVQYLDSKCKEILMAEHYQQNIVGKIIERVKGKLSSLASRSSMSEGEEALDFGETKLNVFKCCELIIQEIEKIRSALENSYKELLDYFNESEEHRCEQFLMYVFRNSYLTRSDGSMRLRKVAGQLAVAPKGSRWFCTLTKAFLQVNMPDFDNIYYLALSKYKIKQEFLYLSLNRRLNFVMQFISEHQSEFGTEKKLIEIIISKEEKAVHREAISKKIMALAYLRIVEYESNLLLGQLIGGDLEWIYGLEIDGGFGV